MFKNAGIATILGLALMAGCAANTGSQTQDLATSDVDNSAERCFHTAGDYDGSDVVPPPINISIGDHIMSAPDAMVAAQTDEREGYARLLAEFVAAQVSIDGGAEIDSDDIDALIKAEDMLVRLDVDTSLTDAFENELVDLINIVGELNDGFRIEAPCMDTDNAGVFEVDAPLAPRPPKYNPRQGHQVIGDASAEPSAPTTDNGFHRPHRPKYPRHWPSNKASKRDLMR
jgi:hypothetical protein